MQKEKQASLGSVSDEKIFNFVKAPKWPSKPLLITEINRRIQTDKYFKERVKHFEAAYALLKNGYNTQNITLEKVRSFLGTKNPTLN